MKTKSRVNACLQCGEEIVQAFKPFCSERCKQLDLHGWLAEKYVIASNSAEKESTQQMATTAESEDEN